MTNHGMTQQDIIEGLAKDETDLETAELELDALKNGARMRYFTIEGAEGTITGLKACIVNKKKMLNI